MVPVGQVLAELGLTKPHRHVTSEARRSRIRHVAGNCYLVWAACRCGAMRKEIVSYPRGMGWAGKVVQAGPWEEREES